jgi:MiaB-like tRNA modifying enzyme
MRIYLETYGCAANQSDSEMILGLLKQQNHEIVNSFLKSDLNILNTCIVKSPTENRMKHRIKQLKKTKIPLLVAGCMSNTQKDTIEKLAPEASIIGPNSIHSVCDIVEKTFDRIKVVEINTTNQPKLCLPKVRRNPVVDIVQISTGCLGNCYYCQTRFAKGKLFSYPDDLILKQIKSSLKKGVKEIWLTSQDTGCYGKDIEKSLPKLLEKIEQIKEKFMVRLGMMNPNHVMVILDKLIESYESDKIFKFLHIPVQSGSDSILEAMNRRYSIEDFKEIVRTFRKRFSMITLSTDIIVGYPGESKQDFLQTINLIKEVEPDIVNISKYWPRPKTKASKMRQLSRKLISSRTYELTKVVKEIKRKKNSKWLNWEGEVLIDKKGKQDMIARNYAYKPVVTTGELGTFRQIRIKETHETYLKGD